MASGWDQAQKKVIRNNGRNTGSTIWDQDAVGGQPIDSQGHDTNDQTLADSITETLHIGGYNEMLANLDVGGFRIVGMADGTGANDGVNKGQLDAVDGKADQNAADIATNTGNIATNASDITSLDGRVTTLENQGVPDPLVANQLKMDGNILNITGNSYNVDTSAANYHTVQNTSAGGHTLTFSGYPAAPDADLGSNYQTQGMVTVFNNATPGPINIAGMPAGYRTIGEPNLDANGASVCSYIIQYMSGTTWALIIWSAA